ncbi:MAG: aldo/keto reductase [Actinomycetaceae bacterium]|nr:aldo/keto reductase [Actinomycetaceae bacterium]
MLPRETTTIQHRPCGDTGLVVSDLGLGTLTWGRDTDAHEAVDMLTSFVGAGGTLVECSPLDGDGHAVDVLAAGLSAVGRHRVTLAWRGGARWTPAGTVPASAARGALLDSLDDSLSRLGTDHVDVWMATPAAHIPLEETLSALEYALSSGRTRYVGLANTDLWDISRAHWAGTRGGVPISVVADEFSLLHCVASEELRGRVADNGMGFFAHAPLAGGVLTGKYRHTTPPDSRAASDHLRYLVLHHIQHGRGIVEAVARAAEGLERTTAAVALAWVRGTPGVASAIIGPRSLRQLEPHLEAPATLPSPIRAVLDEVAGLA